jgi:Holliday junction resolvase RusA-like endonuclease
VNLTPRSKWSVQLPLPPSANHLFATVGNRRVKTKEYRAWIAASLAALVELRKPKSFPVEVRVTVFGAVNPDRDLDNFLKPTIDLLKTGGIIPDDRIRYVTRVNIGYGGEWDGAPAVDVRIEPVVQEQPTSPPLDSRGTLRP